MVFAEKRLGSAATLAVVSFPFAKAVGAAAGARVDDAPLFFVIAVIVVVVVVVVPAAAADAAATASDAGALVVGATTCGEWRLQASKYSAKPNRSVKAAVRWSANWACC